MVEKKSGPVKPPIIDAKPRTSNKPAQKEASASQAADPTEPTPNPAREPNAADQPAASETSKTDAALKSGQSEPGPDKADSVKPTASRPEAIPSEPAGPAGPAPASAEPATPVGALLIAAAGGGLIGVALAYGLASFGLWPQAAADASALSALQSRTAELEASLTERAGETADFETRLEDLQLQVSTLEPPEPVSTEGLAVQADLDALASQISDLSARIEAVAAGASGDEVTDVAQNLSGLSSQVAALTERLDAIEPQVAEAAPALELAMTRLDDLDARIADQSDFEAVASERDRIARLPAALGALETAIASGAPFATQLAKVETLLPALEIPAPTHDAAATGVTPPATLLADFRAAIPAMLAATPRDPQANWAQTLLDQAASTLALRPTDGDSPQGLVGRTEAALAAGDLAGAQTAFAALPQPMQQAAPGFAEALTRAQLAQALLETVRSADPAATPAEAAQ
ncbi:hypothetical protein NO932_18740 [Pelagibacterium sp. 26DY04]|uniref:COG4223 family protein n=1 Tax=Pelagibacterium sp. 26DY04 TaxID=2967130 RepID=UPI002815FBEF|nr:hypothetical protein [Pelagibacterium sp. 26DY04]WMT86904.1 hypothetical protein NO932_18740 [Pelagibacterium sp. 26DY04]